MSNKLVRKKKNKPKYDWMQSEIDAAVVRAQSLNESWVTLDRLNKTKTRWKGKTMENNWIDINDRLPNPGEYVLVSFENVTLPDIGRYETDSDGSGAFYPGDDDASYASFGIFVNAWMPLPEIYRREE